MIVAVLVVVVSVAIGVYVSLNRSPITTVPVVPIHARGRDPNPCWCISNSTDSSLKLLYHFPFPTMNILGEYIDTRQAEVSWVSLIEQWRLALQNTGGCGVIRPYRTPLENTAELRSVVQETGATCVVWAFSHANLLAGVGDELKGLLDGGYSSDGTMLLPLSVRGMVVVAGEGTRRETMMSVPLPDRSVNMFHDRSANQKKRRPHPPAAPQKQ